MYISLVGYSLGEGVKKGVDEGRARGEEGKDKGYAGKGQGEVGTKNKRKRCMKKIHILVVELSKASRLPAGAGLFLSLGSPCTATRHEHHSYPPHRNAVTNLWYLL